MKQLLICLSVGIAVTATAPSALAASDYLLQFDGVEGEATAAIEIQSWSLGASNPSVADEAAKKGGGASVGKPNPGKMNRNAGTDQADLATVANHDVIEGFALTFDKASPVLAKLCAQGQHIKNAKIVGRGAVYDLQVGSMTGCPKSAEFHNAGPAVAGSPARISTNMTVPKQTQGATFGEKVNQGLHAAGSIVVRFTGQMKHQKTGHVTLMK